MILSNRVLLTWLVMGILFIRPWPVKAGEWIQHQNSLAASKLKIDGIEGSIGHSIEEYKATLDSQRRQDISVAIDEQRKLLKEEQQKFREEYEHVQFRHPERGAVIKNQFDPQKVFESSIDIDADLEEVPQTLDEMMSRVHEKMISLYGDFSVKKEKKRTVFEFEKEAKKAEEKEAARPILKK